MKSNSFLLVAVLCAFFVRSVCAQSAPASSPAPPKCFIQVLNGISSGPVDVYFGNNLVFPALPVGQRVFMYNSPTEKFELRVVEQKSSKEFKEKVELAQGGYYTLVLYGDFHELPLPDTAKPGDPIPVRVQAKFMENKPGSDSPVRVRFVNSVVDRPVVVGSKRDNKTWTVPPMGTISVTGLPEDLVLDASLGDKKRGLFLAQKSPAQNISMVFFPLRDALGFKAIAEINGPPKGAAPVSSPEAEKVNKQ